MAAQAEPQETYADQKQIKREREREDLGKEEGLQANGRLTRHACIAFDKFYSSGNLAAKCGFF